MRMCSYISGALVAGILLFASSDIVANGVWHMAHAGGPDACEGFGFDPGCDKNWSLHALQFDDLTVTGQFDDEFAGGGGIHGAVDCLYVEGNFAFAGGPVTWGGFEGLNFFVVVVI